MHPLAGSLARVVSRAFSGLRHNLSSVLYLVHFRDHSQNNKRPSGMETRRSKRLFHAPQTQPGATSIIFNFV
jgi:hypothetical protein